jgi:hypothetical protein
VSYLRSPPPPSASATVTSRRSGSSAVTKCGLGAARRCSRRQGGAGAGLTGSKPPPAGQPSPVAGRARPSSGGPSDLRGQHPVSCARLRHSALEKPLPGAARPPGVEAVARVSPDGPATPCRGSSYRDPGRERTDRHFSPGGPCREPPPDAGFTRPIRHSPVGLPTTSLRHPFGILDDSRPEGPPAFPVDRIRALGFLEDRARLGSLNGQKPRACVPQRRASGDTRTCRVGVVRRS